MNTVLIGIIVYILLQLLVGVYCSRRIASEDDYLLAGRSLGVGMASLSVFATWFGAETCIGAAGSVYENGLSGATVDPFGYTLCLVLMGLVFATHLWRRNLTTLADLFTQRYSAKIQNFAVLLIAPTSIMWAAAQVRAFGQVLSSASGLEVEIAIAAAALVVIVYTMYGGLLADVVTDAVQGVALIIGLLLLLVLVLEAGGGIEASVARIEPERLGFFGTSAKPGLETLEQWAIPICGSVLSQELVARVLASRSPEVARRSCVYGGLLYLAVGLIPVTIGLFGIQLLPGLNEPEQILPNLAQKYLHTFFYIIFAGALISAILSTVDSALLAASALLSHNLIVPMLKIGNDEAKVKIARLMVLASGIVAFALALNAGRVYTLVEEASAFGSAGIFTVVIFGLFTSFGGVISAGVTLAAGMLTWIVGHHVLDLATPYLVSLSVAFASYLLVGSWESMRAGNMQAGLIRAWLRSDR
ncbi:sodium:solute symporter family protein [Methylomicrobium lacus]|uniref:sodium:solute symporter family protein n=1 Tax=Methylomicrobium lacus TaxID=136992 RepID=UPI0035A85306